MKLMKIWKNEKKLDILYLDKESGDLFIQPYGTDFVIRVGTTSVSKLVKDGAQPVKLEEKQ